MEDLGRKLGNDSFGRLENARKSELPPGVRTAVDKLPVNQVTPPIEEANRGYVVFMVCSRSALGVAGALPSRDVIRRQIEEARMDLQGKRYLRDLRRAAFVEFRL